MRFYCAVPTAADADRIVADGFDGRDRVTVKLPYENPPFLDQPGILVSTELDPSTGFAIEIDASPNAVYLRRLKPGIWAFL